jgi:phage-related protein
VFYREEDGSVPVSEWLDRVNSRVVAKVKSRLILLEERGHELLRPVAEYLVDGIYELRIISSGQRYRILYGFHGRNMVMLLSAFAKSSQRVPRREIILARSRYERFVADPGIHSQVEELR